MVRGLIEHQEVRPGDQGPGQSHATPFSTRQLADLALIGRASQLVQSRADPRVDRPTLELLDALLQMVMATGMPRKILELMDEGEDMACSIARGLENREIGIEFKGLGQIPRDQIPAPSDHTVIGLGFIGQEPHEGRFAGTVPTHESDAVARRQGQ